jgi:hypothetical protein
MKQWMWLGAMAAVSTLGSVPAGALTMTQKCVIANTLCFSVRAAAAGMTPQQRIDHVNDRLAVILGHETLQPENLRTRQTAGGDVEIWVGRSLLATVTRADARANGSADPQSVADRWASNLRAALPQARP